MNKVVKHLTNNYLVLFIILYYAIGSYIFSNYYINEDYITKFINILTNQNLNLIFILPSFILITSYVYKELNNYNLILRFPSRTKYMKYVIKTLFKVNSIIYLLIILITFIVTNLTQFSNITIATLYNSTNLFIMISSIIKLWIYVIIFSLLTITLYFIFSRSSYANLLCFIIMCLNYFSKYITGTYPILNYLFPKDYILDTNNIFKTLTINNLTSALYFTILLIIIIFILIKTTNNKQFLNEEGKE